jgi:D-inositol-3-phosphate glycosyltransferase
MRVALLTMHSCPLGPVGERDTGGMNVYVTELARELEARDFCVDIFTRYHTPRDPEIVPVGPKTRVIHIPTGSPDEKKDVLPARVDQFVRGVHAFARREELTYSLVHSHYWLSGQAGMELSSLWSTPHLVSFHTLAETKNEAFSENSESPERAPMETRIARSADRIIAWTEHEAAALIQKYGAPAERIVIAPIGVDLRLFTPSDSLQARRRLDIKPDDDVVLYVGRLDAIKGPRVLLKAVAQLRDRPRMHVILVGGDQADGDTTRLQEFAGELGLNGQVTFAGSILHQELPWYYSAADVQVIPSYYESFSMVTAEALASGTPVIASDVGGPATLVQHGVAGYLVPPADETALAERLTEILDDVPLRKRFAEAAPATVSHLAWRSVVDRVVGVYASALEGVEEIPACVD